MKALHSSAKTGGSDLWITGPEVFKPLDREFEFVLDASAENAEASRCTWFISPELDALGPKSWRAQMLGVERGVWDKMPTLSVWLNPPFSKADAFIRRAWQECRGGNLRVVMFLTAALETAAWQQVIFKHAREVRAPDRRLSCIAGEDVYGDVKGVRTLTVPKGQRGPNAPKANAIVIFDPYYDGPPTFRPMHVMSPAEWAKEQSR